EVRRGRSAVVRGRGQRGVRAQPPLQTLESGSKSRHYTYGGDLAKGIRVCIERPAALNEDFNISTAESTTVLELAQAIWGKLKPGVPFRYRSDEPFKYDVQRRGAGGDTAEAGVGGAGRSAPAHAARAGGRA